MKRTASIFALATLAGLAVASATQTAIVLMPGGSVTVTVPGQVSGPAQSLAISPGDTAIITAEAAAPAFNPYLVAGVCPGGLPPNNCANPVQMTVDTPRTWRRGDYGNGADVNNIYMLVDAVLSASGQSAIFDWDFSRYGAAYGGLGFTPKRGDGGETYIVSPNGAISAPATEDGGTLPVPPATFAVQYFCGIADGGMGWVDGSTTPPTGSWASGVALLGRVLDPNTPCPLPLNTAFTRWRHEMLPITFTFWDATNTTHVAQTLTLDCMIGEHYGNADITTAPTMEQGVWCKNWGRVWFAAYSAGVPAGSPGQTVMADYAPWPKPPERPDMTLQNCRYWTNVILTPGGTPESAFGWPPPGVAP